MPLVDVIFNYFATGGAGLEKHAFAHLDCPFDEESGVFMLGKFEGEELHLTAFKIPTRHTLYVPPYTIHCNDYLKVGSICICLCTSSVNNKDLKIDSICLSTSSIIINI